MVDFDSFRASILTEEAEETCDLLMLSAAEHSKVQRSISGWKLDPSEGSNTALSYVMRCVILVEVFTFQRVLDLSDDHAGTITSPVFDHLYRAHRKQIDRSWANAIQALDLWPGSVPVKDYAEYPALQGYVLARNSWAHGHGRLTSMQLQDRIANEKNAANAGFRIVDGFVKVKPDQIGAVARTCRAFVRRVDGGTRGHLR